MRLLKLTAQTTPLVLVGAINALTALLAEQAGHKALYLSGAGVANADFALPDLGLTDLSDVVAATQKITEATDLPLLVDADTGWGSVLNIQRTVQQLSLAGAAGIHLEDQEYPKRCGHRVGKRLISTARMVDHLKAALDARIHDDFLIMARTDAVSVEGIDAAIARAMAYSQAGVDAIFAEAVTTLDDYKKFTAALGSVPVLANITEFGQTPLFTVQQLQQVGVKMVLYPLSAMRAMNFAALQVYRTILQQGSQQACVGQMQTREELYKLLDYYTYEQIADDYRGKHDRG